MAYVQRLLAGHVKGRSAGSDPARVLEVLACPRVRALGGIRHGAWLSGPLRYQPGRPAQGDPEEEKEEGLPVPREHPLVP